tara:strand:+ start:637 stop:936 length:300 start_codon:yes stop_codon:yes gene_type:complete
MAVFSVQIDDADVARVLDAVAANYGRSDQIDNPDFNPELDEDPVSNPLQIDNPESKSVFANRMVRKFLSDHVAAYEVKLAKQQAANALNTNVNITDPQV